MLNTNEKFTIPIGMGTTITPYGNAYDILMPGAVMAIVPIVLIFLACRKTFMLNTTGVALDAVADSIIAYIRGKA